ncbi:MAG: enolase C-terminal domain-like protein [Dehalococcoidia bacterium]
MTPLARVAWRPFRLPLRAETHAAHGTTATREGLLIVVEGVEGARGLGEASPFPSYTGGSVEECAALVASVAPGLLASPADSLWRSLPPLPGGHPGSLAALACGIETALADLLARGEGVPLHRFLRPRPGGDADAVVEANTVIDNPDPMRAAEETRDAVQAGFTTLKVKAGFDLDRQRFAAVRAVAGPFVRLRADANGAWDEAAALDALPRLAAAGVELLEQPLPALSGPAALARLRAASPVRIAADEACRTMSDLAALLASNAIDAVVVKPMASGLRESLAILAAAREAALEAIVTTTFDAGIGTALAMHLAATLDEPRPACGIATHARLAADIVTGVPAVAGGRVTLPGIAHIPGLGVTLDEAALEAHATGPWQEVRR